MAAYSYQALDAGGRTRKGVIQADTPRDARQQLRDQGLNPLAVEAVAGRSARTATGGGRRLLRRGDLTLLLRELATLSRAGLPLEESLAALSQQAHRGGLRQRLAALRAALREGESLAGAMQHYPRDFPPMVTAAIAAGERSGRLDPVLQRLAEYAEGREALGRDVWLALIYPMLVAVVAIGVTTGLLIYVVPQVTTVFERGGQTLPWLTRALISFSQGLQSHGPVVLLSAAAAVAVLVWLLRQEGWRLRLARGWRRLPLLGHLSRAADSARLARTLALLTASAVPLVEALRVAGGVLQSPAGRQAVAAAADRVREGRALTPALTAAGLFSPVALRLIGSGEQAGDLPAMLERVAEIQEREVSTRLSLLVAVLQPAMILLVGLMVLLIVLAIMLPIFELNQMAL